MADIISGDVEALRPTAAEKAAIKEMLLPRFVDRRNVLVVKDEETGERTFVIQQDLPAYLRRKNVKRYTVHSAGRKVGRREMRDVERRAKTLANRIRADEGDLIELPGPQGQRMFFRVMRRGWFHARYFDLPPKKKNESVRRILSIDSGPGAAQVEADLDMYEGFREVKGG